MQSIETLVRNASANSVWTNVREVADQMDKGVFVEYTSPLSTGPFPITFSWKWIYFVDVRRILSDGTKIRLRPITDFTIDVAPITITYYNFEVSPQPLFNGGNVYLSSPLLSGQTLYIGIQKSFVDIEGLENFNVDEAPRGLMDAGPDQQTLLGTGVYSLKGFGSAHKFKNKYENQPPRPTNGNFFSEVGRSTHVVRVTNPLNENQYVDVRVIDYLDMVSSDGKSFSFYFNNP